MKPKKLLLSSALTVVVAISSMAPTAKAANAAWNTNATSGDFNTAQWTSGTTTPGTGSYTVLSGDALFFGTSTTVALNNNLTGASFAGITFNSGASAFTIGGNSFTLTGNITNSSSNLQTISNSITISGNRSFAGGTGGLALGGTITSSTFITYNGVVNLTGATTIDGGATNGNGYATIGTAAGATTVTISNGGSLLAKTSTATATTGNNMIIGQNNNGTSTLNVGAVDKSSSGTFTVNGQIGFALGNNQTTAIGILNVNAGTATINSGSTTATDNRSFIALGRDGGTGTINLNGGTLETGRQFVRDGSSGGTVGAGTATFNFNGGVLKALANQTSGNGWFETATTGHYQVVTTIVKAGGAKIDTNGFNANIGTVLAHDSNLGGTADGGLTKSGLGSLTLGGANTYTGATSVTQGKLKVENTIGASDVSVSGTGTILASDAAATIGKTVSIGSGSVLAAGDKGSIGTATVGGASTFNSGSIFSWDINSSTNNVANNGGTYDKLVTTGVVNGGAAHSSVFQIVTSASDLAGSFWDTNHTWTDIITTDGSTGVSNWADLFSVSVVDSNGNSLASQAAVQGSFTLTGNTLSWSAVPEPTTALAGLLLGAGLLRRRRHAAA